MDRLHGVLTAAAVVGAVVAVKALLGGAEWERRASAAEQIAAAAQPRIDSLSTVASVAEAKAARVDTVRVTLTKLIVHTDSVSRPDSTCGPSLAARDTALAAAQSEVTQWELAYRAQIGALSLVTAQRDTLAAALAARPRTGFTLELLHPRVTVSAGVDASLHPRLLLGVPLVSFRL